MSWTGLSVQHAIINGEALRHVYMSRRRQGLVVLSKNLCNVTACSKFINASIGHPWFIDIYGPTLHVWYYAFILFQNFSRVGHNFALGY